MLKGGYKIIDFKELPLDAGGSANLEGMYNLFINNKKAVLISGLNIDGELYDDTFVNVIYYEDGIRFNFRGYDIYIDNTDEVYINKNLGDYTHNYITIDYPGDINLENGLYLWMLQTEPTTLHFGFRTVCFSGDSLLLGQGGLIGEAEEYVLDGLDNPSYIKAKSSPGLSGSFILNVKDDIVFISMQQSK